MDEIGRFLRDVYPATIKFSNGPLNWNIRSGYLSELKHVVNATQKRKVEFYNGRFHARNALEQLGIERQQLPVLPDRSPNWPAGCVGSISHSNDHVVSTVALSHDILSLGVDVQDVDELDFYCVRNVLLHDSEFTISNTNDLAINLSAKEAFKKLYMPIMRSSIEYNELVIDLNYHKNTFSVKLVTSKLPTFRFHNELCGHFEVISGNVISTIYLRT